MCNVLTPTSECVELYKHKCLTFLGHSNLERVREKGVPDHAHSYTHTQMAQTDRQRSKGGAVRQNGRGRKRDGMSDCIDVKLRQNKNKRP